MYLSGMKQKLENILLCEEGRTKWTVMQVISSKARKSFVPAEMHVYLIDIKSHILAIRLFDSTVF